MRIAIDKNFENILSKARQERSFVEQLLFKEDKIRCNIDRPNIKLLHTDGLIKDDGKGFVTFWVPFYKKRLYNAFYPYTNGEYNEINLIYIPSGFYDEQNKFTIQKLIEHYKTYVKRRGFKPFLEKDEAGNYKSLKLNQAIYLVFLPKRAHIPDYVKEQTENIDSINISTYLIIIDDEKW